ncbi:MAG: hypothetical protein IT375_20095 [Polyangiaceae bacterium]|nr:hypothetical protein [Polyangiaceae bacterium]
MIDWPRNWDAEPPLEVLLTMGGDLNVAGVDAVPGAGGFNLAAFRWERTRRLGFLAGVSCAIRDEGGRCAYVVPLGFEANWLARTSDSRDGVRAYLGAGARGVVYAPISPRSTPVLSPQAALRGLVSFSTNDATDLPLGLTLDHGLYAGPAVTPSGSTALFVGFSLGVGWAE